MNCAGADQYASTPTPRADAARPVPVSQQEQEARFVVTDDADIFDSKTKRIMHVRGFDFMAVRDYARAIAAALNANPPKEPPHDR